MTLQIIGRTARHRFEVHTSNRAGEFPRLVRQPLNPKTGRPWQASQFLGAYLLVDHAVTAAYAAIEDQNAGIAWKAAPWSTLTAGERRFVVDWKAGAFHLIAYFGSRGFWQTTDAVSFPVRKIDDRRFDNESFEAAKAAAIAERNRRALAALIADTQAMIDAVPERARVDLTPEQAPLWNERPVLDD